jgi:hypothetical protein
MKFLKYTVIALWSLTNNYICPKQVEYTEDVYSVQAPQELVSLAQKAADLMEFKGSYEVISPKKPALQINPWNKFVGYGINPQTKNSFIVINPQWFSNIPEDQKLFLLSRNFLTLKLGTIPVSMKIAPFIFSFIGILLMFVLFWLLGRTKLVSQKLIRALIAFATVATLNLIFINPLAIKLNRYLGARYDMQINEMAVQKTQNKDAAIKALEYFDGSIKKELAGGETFWEPNVKLFENYANELKIN